MLEDSYMTLLLLISPEMVEGLTLGYASSDQEVAGMVVR